MGIKININTQEPHDYYLGNKNPSPTHSQQRQGDGEKGRKGKKITSSQEAYTSIYPPTHHALPPSAASSPHPFSYAPRQDERFLVHRADIIRTHSHVRKEGVKNKHTPV